MFYCLNKLKLNFKIFLLIFIFNFKFLYSDNKYSIIFVHLGDSLPSYLEYSITNARLFNPEAAIYLVANKIALTKKNSPSYLMTNKIDNIYCEDLPESNFHNNFIINSPLDNNFREGFWKKASERLFYLEECVKKYDLKNVFHLENDVMLYTNLDEMISTFELYPNMAAVFDNDNRCIPSFIYINNSKALTDMISFISLNAKNGLNDMESIALYKNKFGRNYIDNLPIIMPEYLQEYSLKSTAGHTTLNSFLYCNNINNFKSIFDAAALGQFLGGIDPRNDISVPGFINESCLFNSSYLSYKWELDQLGRRVPYAIFKEKKYRINNLHIHSKKLEQFKS